MFCLIAYLKKKKELKELEIIQKQTQEISNREKIEFIIRMICMIGEMAAEVIGAVALFTK